MNKNVRLRKILGVVEKTNPYDFLFPENVKLPFIFQFFIMPVSSASSASSEKMFTVIGIVERVVEHVFEIG